MGNRWIIAAAGVLMQLALGAVYAWSVFRIPLTKQYGWSIAQVTLVFQITILIVGFAAFAAGIWMRRSGPRPIALTAAVLYGAGTMLAGFATSLGMLYLAYGVIAGIGLGLGYIVPVATLLKWFPDRKGMITGVAVTGFGSGALITAPVAQRLITSVGVSRTFQILGLAYLVIVFASALFMRNPPAGYRPPAPAGGAAAGRGRPERDFTFRQALATWQWYALWMALFLNTSAGIAIISQASPMGQEIAHVSATTAAGLVGIISIANGAGRLFWAWLSDGIGRRNVFLIMFLAQAVAFFLLSNASSFAMVTVLAVAVLLCYGGGFGTMPAFAADFFGSKDIGSVYGLMLTAWGFAALFGPGLIAQIREATGQYQGAFRILALVMLVSAALPLFLRAPKSKEAVEPVNS